MGYNAHIHSAPQRAQMSLIRSSLSLVKDKRSAVAFFQRCGLLHEQRLCLRGHDMILSLTDKEDRWRCHRFGTHRRMLDSYMCEFMWRQRVRNHDPFDKILEHIRLLSFVNIKNIVVFTVSGFCHFENFTGGNWKSTSNQLIVIAKLSNQLIDCN